MLVNTHDKAQDIINRLRDGEHHIVYDAETSGLDWKRNHIIGHVITFDNGVGSYYIPVRHAGGGNLEGCKPESDATGWDGERNWFEDAIVPLLHNKTITFHNGAFDLKFLHRIGYTPQKGKVADTMIGAYLVNELRPKLSLEACCIDEGVQPKKGMQLYQRIAEYTDQPLDPKYPAKLMGSLWQLPGDDPDVVDYSVGDGTSTYQLEQALSKKIREPYYTNQYREYSLEKVARVEFDLMPVINEMMTTGVKIDMERFEELYESIATRYDEAMEKTGDINVRSPKEMLAYFQRKGITEGWPLTPKGAPSFNEKWLKTTDAGQDIITVRKLRTLRDSFLNPMKERHILDGRLYPNFSQTRDENFGTKTGRLSAHDPNLQAQPGKRQGDLGKEFRTLYIPDNGFWVSADYETCEIVICAHYCKAKVWIEGFDRGIKAHQSVSDAIGIPYQHAKTINLGLMTGMGRGALAEDLGLPFEEANQVVNQYFAGLPELKRFQYQSKRAFANRGFVSTLLGRRLRLEDHSKAYKAVNRLTQGGNADVIKERMIAMHDLSKELGNTRLILNVHDDISFETDTEDKMHQMLDCMRDMSSLGLSLPMGVEYGRGPNWGVASFEEEGRLYG
jgi:DNA polymerase I-like protein with 3'-5' exonuclease and polymerase domains